MIPILGSEKRWFCPNCKLTDVTDASVPNRYHTCPKLRYLPIAPMVPAGTKARVFIREREDYVGTEGVQLDPEQRRPVMSIITERPDGSNDTIVLAPVVTGAAEVS